MVSKWFVAAVEIPILAATAMPIPEQIRAACRSLWKWPQLLWKHPAQAFWSLWMAFWKSWSAVGIMATLLYAAAVVPDMFGFGTAKVCFLLGDILFFVRLSLEEKLHGKKGNRKHAAQRAAITIILLGFFGFISFLECGSLANKEKGQPATARNIWAESFWWRQHAQKQADPDTTGYLRTVPSDLHFDFAPYPRYVAYVRFATTNLGKQIPPNAIYAGSLCVHSPMSAAQEDAFFAPLHIKCGGNFGSTENNYWEHGDSRSGETSSSVPWEDSIDGPNGLSRAIEQIKNGQLYVYFFVRHKFADRSGESLATESCFYFRGPKLYQCHGHNGPAEWPKVSISVAGLTSPVFSC
jgi:hypothetical protein